MARPVRARPLLAYVMALAAAMTVPPLVLAVVTTTRWVTAERERLETVTGETNDRAMSQVDRFLAGKVAMLQALATSPAIDLGDFMRVDVQARELLDLQGLNIVMRDLHGQQFVNTRVAFGTVLPRVPIYDADHVVAATKAPVISDLYAGVMARGPLVRVIVPVIRDGAVRYTLTASLAPSALALLLQEAGIAEPYFASIADRSGHILARAQHDDSRVGTKLPGFEQASGQEGTWSGTNPQGVFVYATYRRSKLSGWLFAVGVDRAYMDAPLFRSLWWLGSLAVVLGLLAFAASSFLARQILLSHRQIEAAAEALGNGEVVTPPDTRLTETNLIGRALSDASNRLRDQAAALVSANKHLEQRVQERTREVSEQASLLHATLDNMDQGLLLIGADGNVPVCNQRAMELLDLPPSLMAGRPAFLDILRYQTGMGEFLNSEPGLAQWVEAGGLEQKAHTYERERPNGCVLEIRTVPLANGGAVRTYADVTARKVAERLSHHMARHDGLTGLPNRTLFRERLTQELAGSVRHGRPFAVFCLDLDRFKAVNDTLGHPAGDALLGIVAERIKATVRAEDVVVRLGGDEFSIIQLGGLQPKAASALAERLVDAVRQPFDVGGHVINVGVSIGIALAPADGSDADQIFKSADLALYRAKNEGRNTFRFYEAAMDVAVQARQALELDLRQALARGEFELHYQPVIDVRDGSISGFEALIRWQHPLRGLIGPTEFIPLAEDTRLIIPIGAWVLREACREAASWPGSTRVQVNISAIQVEDPGLFGSVLAALGASGLAASRLQLEITESVLMHECETVLGALQSLRDFGARIALDDFGTGYSSLSYLQQFPLDAVKIDRSFVAGYENPTTAAIFCAIVGLGQGLGMSVTAEGVETPEQLEHVRRSGCLEVQGYLFSRPVSGEEARKLLSRPATAAAA